jgi:tripartite ATP-independent transporter DctP family solute receptor
MKTNMKRFLTLAMALSIAVCISACGGGEKKGDKSANSSSGGEKKLSIGYTTAANKNDPYHVTATKFKEIVESKSKGKIKVNLYPSSQLGSEPEMWEGMQTGTCDMAVMTNAYLSTYVHANGVLDLPFIFADLKQARSVLDGAYGQKLIDNINKSGVTCLAFSEGGFRQLCTRDKGVSKPSDLAGLKIRCMETKIYLSAYKALGVNATPMAWGELLTALQQGTVDGCDAPLSVLYTNGFPDVAKYIDNVNLFYSPLPVCISTGVLKSFSADDQKMLESAAKEASSFARKNNDDTAQSMESDLTKKGMTIVKKVDTQGFRTAAQKCWTEMESYIGADWVKELKSTIGLK